MSRPAIAFLPLSPPPLIPRLPVLLAAASRPELQAFHAQASALVEPMSSSSMVEVLKLLLVGLPDLTTPLPDEESEDAAHDRYFHVQRVDGDAVRTLVRMALLARLTLLEEVQATPVRVAHQLVEQIDRSLADLSGATLGLSNLPAVRHWQWMQQIPDANPDSLTQAQAMGRWVRGHQVFAALTQGLILSFQSLGGALRDGRQEDVQGWSNLAVSLLLGSAATFRLTSDFSVELYAEVIRPSMMPPASPICLSGLMSWDHRYLVQVIRDMRPALRSLYEREPFRHQQISQALASVYDSHIHICERFVGERPSILTAERTERSGPSLIEQFKALRLKPFEVLPQAAPLSPQIHTGNRLNQELTCPLARAAAAGADAPGNVPPSTAKES